MHKSAMKCTKTLGKWCKNKHGASKIMDTFEMYHPARSGIRSLPLNHLVFICQMLHAHLQFAYRGYAEGRKCAKIAAMAAVAEAMSW
jgi:hypothetical protein